MPKALVCSTLVAALAWAAVPSLAYAEKFLGVEGANGPAATTPAASPMVATAPQPTERPTATAPGEGDWSFAGGLGAGAGFISARATVDYGLGRYAGVATTYSYYRYEKSNITGVQQGPEVDLVLRGPNPTIVTPFAGAGPGYLRWQRRYQGAAYADAGALTLNAFAGFNIRLTHHFGIQIERRQMRYLDQPPQRFDNRDMREGSTQIATNIGFHAMF